MDDVALDAACSTIQPGYVDARKVESPRRDPVHNGCRHVAQRRRRSEGVLYGASPHHMPTDLIERGPQIRVRVVATPETHQDPRVHGAREVSVFATRVKRFRSREEAASLSEESDLVHAWTMCTGASISSPSLPSVEKPPRHPRLWIVFVHAHRLRLRFITLSRGVGGSHGELAMRTSDSPT